MRAALAKWAAFGVFIPLAPLAASYFTRLATADIEVTLFSVLSTGQLALLAAPLAARGIGDVLPAGKDYPAISFLFCGVSLSVILLGALFYAGVQNQAANPSIVGRWSAAMYGLALVVSFGCVIVGDAAKRP